VIPTQTHALWSRRTDVAADDVRATPRLAYRGTLRQCREEMRFQRESTGRSGGDMPYPPRDYVVTTRDANGAAAFRALDEGLIVEHIPGTVPRVKMDTPVGLFSGSCSCGWRSTGLGSQSSALKDATQHADAKTAQATA
jgi:hypothetical protein